jgi:lactoylglutathione lyase
LNSTIEKLKQKRVKFFKKPKEEPFGKHAIVQDPDGHLISIAEIKEKSSEGFDLLGLIGAE